MIIDTKKLEKLIKSEWTGSQISKLVDVKQQMFDRYRKGDNQVENMSLKIAGELMKIIKLEEKSMYKLTVKEEGKLQDIENFNKFENLKQHLIENDYFGWINEEEPERELPDFEEVESVEEVQKIFEEFDYSWWTMEVEHNEEMELEAMKDKLKVETLIFSHYDNGLHELEFHVDDKKVFVKNIKVDEEVDEFYWDDEENIKKAVEEASDSDVERV